MEGRGQILGPGRGAQFRACGVADGSAQGGTRGEGCRPREGLPARTSSCFGGPGGPTSFAAVEPEVPGRRSGLRSCSSRVLPAPCPAFRREAPSWSRETTTPTRPRARRGAWPGRRGGVCAVGLGCGAGAVTALSISASPPGVQKLGSFLIAGLARDTWSHSSPGASSRTGARWAACA